jgi:hypothetical protein
MTSARGEVASERGTGGDEASWANVNLTGSKNEENAFYRFNPYKWTVKI